MNFEQVFTISLIGRKLLLSVVMMSVGMFLGHDVSCFCIFFYI